MAEPKGGRVTPAKPKAETNGNGAAMATAEALLARARPERVVPLDGVGSVRLRAVPRPDYDRLVGEHPRPDDANHVWPFDVDTFAPALIAACLVEPELTLEQVQSIWAEWETDALDQLWNAALDLNTGWSPRARTKKG